jgi:hypothetical protein
MLCGISQRSRPCCSSSSFITTDKPAGFLWVMELSARVFGVSYWSLLVPQALAGVATVGVLYTTVRRWFGPRAGLVASAVMALTPVAALMFRFDDQDALLTLMITLAGYAMTRAVESGRTRWVVLAGVLVGAGFLSKFMAAFMVLPALALAYLQVSQAPPSVRARGPSQRQFERSVAGVTAVGGPRPGSRGGTRMPSADGVLVAAIVLVLTGAGLPEVATLQNGHRTGTGFLAVLVTGEAAPRAGPTGPTGKLRDCEQALRRAGFHVEYATQSTGECLLARRGTRGR